MAIKEPLSTAQVIAIHLAIKQQGVNTLLTLQLSIIHIFKEYQERLICLLAEQFSRASAARSSVPVLAFLGDADQAKSPVQRHPRLHIARTVDAVRRSAEATPRL